MKSTYNAQEEINELRQTITDLSERMDVAVSDLMKMGERLDKLDKSLSDIARTLGMLEKTFNTYRAETSLNRRPGSVADKAKSISQVAPSIDDIFNRYYGTNGGSK